MASIEFQAFDTPCVIDVRAGSVSVEEERTLLSGIQADCVDFEHAFSRFNSGSELYALNHAGGLWTPISAHLYNLISAALFYCEETDGLFDITMGSVCKLWNFRAQTVPSQTSIDEALKHVNWHNIETRQNDDGKHESKFEARIKDPEATIDLGGIAKGYIADAIASKLRNAGVASALINLGGNVMCVGAKPDGSPWRVGIRRPVPSNGKIETEALAAIPVIDKSVVTSGTYERAFIKGTDYYHHILDPKTGQPAETDVISATVVSDKSLDGDGYTTALIAMGSERALAFAQEHAGIDVVLLTKDGRLISS